MAVDHLLGLHRTHLIHFLWLEAVVVHRTRTLLNNTGVQMDLLVNLEPPDGTKCTLATVEEEVMVVRNGNPTKSSKVVLEAGGTLEEIAHITDTHVVGACLCI